MNKALLIITFLVTNLSYAQEVSPFNLSFNQKEQQWEINGVQVTSRLQNTLSKNLNGTQYRCSGVAILDFADISDAFLKQKEARLEKIEIERTHCKYVIAGLPQQTCYAEVSRMEFEASVIEIEYLKSLPSRSIIIDLGDCLIP